MSMEKSFILRLSETMRDEIRKKASKDKISSAEYVRRAVQEKIESRK